MELNWGHEISSIKVEKKIFNWKNTLKLKKTLKTESKFKTENKDLKLKQKVLKQKKCKLKVFEL